MLKAGRGLLEAQAAMDGSTFVGLTTQLDEYLSLYDGCFARSEGRAHLRRYVRGQLSDLPRKSVEPMADHAGVPPRTLQEFLAGHRWDHPMAWQVLRTEVGRMHADDQAVGVIDETSYPKCGDKTVGVQRQHCGATGKIDNCLVSVHVGYSWDTERCQCVLASDLYLPRSWLEDPEASREAGVPEGLVFREKWRIALDLLRETLASGVRFGWLTFDEFYGASREFLREVQGLGQRYVAEVPKSTMGWLRAPTVLQRGAYQGRGRKRRFPRLSRKSLPACIVENLLTYSPQLRKVPWENFYIKDTDKGPLVWRAKAHRFYFQEAVAGAGHDRYLPGTELWVLVAQNPLTGETKYFLSNAAAGVPLEQLMKVAFSRWHIERCFQDQKGELGLDHFECRRYVAVQRHLLLTAISHLFLTRLRRTQLRAPCPDPATDGGGKKDAAGGTDDAAVGLGSQRLDRHPRPAAPPAPAGLAAGLAPSPAHAT
jgi:SRSO17 transposase